MKTYFKFLSNNLFYTFVTVFGFAVSLMFVFLITVYTTQELSVDSFQEKGDRITIMADEESVGNAYHIGFKLKERYPEIEEVVHFTSQEAHQPVTIDGNKIIVKTLITDRSFFDVFSFPLVEGNKETLFRDKNEAVISESFARKAFPNKNPIGEVLYYHDNAQPRIVGIMKDIRNSAIPYADVVLPAASADLFNGGLLTEELHNAGGFVLAVLTRPGADLNAKKDDILSFFKEFYWVYKEGRTKDVRFVPLHEFYFAKITAWGQLETGEKSFVLILVLVGVLILLFAVFNYINLTVSQTSFRAREMSTRNLLGASPDESFVRLITESIVLILFSFGLGVLLAYLCTPYVEGLLNTTLQLSRFFSLGNVLLIIVLIGALGVVSGIIPAYMISKFKPIDVVKGTFRMKNRMVFSKVFIVIQNVISIVLITLSIVIARQVNHLLDAPLGYHHENIIMLRNGTGNYADWQPLAQKLEALPSVKRVAFSQGSPLWGSNNFSFQYEGENRSIQIIEVDQAFFDMLGFEVLIPNRTEGGKLYLTEQAYKHLDIDDDMLTLPISSWWGKYQTGDPIGKISNFRPGNILTDYQAVMVKVKQFNAEEYPWNVLIEVQGDPVIAYNQVKEVYQKETEVDFEGMYLKDILNESFGAQKRLLKIVLIFGGIAILISALGLIAISTYFIRQRKREIALRKVLGATNATIVHNLVSSFLTYVGIAFLIAVPIAFFFLRNWLDDFAYRITLNPLYFLLAGLICFLVSLLAVFFQSFRAANANPVNALKSE